jgi:hypothetical protein
MHSCQGSPLPRCDRGATSVHSHTCSVMGSGELSKELLRCGRAIFASESDSQETLGRNSLSPSAHLIASQSGLVSWRRRPTVVKSPRGLSGGRPSGLEWADLPEGRLCLDHLPAMAVVGLLALRKRIPRETRKSSTAIHRYPPAEGGAPGGGAPATRSGSTAAIGVALVRTSKLEPRREILPPSTNLGLSKSANGRNSAVTTPTPDGCCGQVLDVAPLSPLGRGILSPLGKQDVTSLRAASVMSW